MNNGTSSSTKPSLKWAFMLIFLSTLIVCLLHYYSLTKYSFWNTSYNPDEFAFPKSSCDTQVMKKKYYDLKCMDDWLQHDDAIIMKKVQSILSPEFLQPFINNKENCSKYSITETKNVSNLLHYGVGTSSKYPDLSSSLDLIHHLPHFSEMFFNFFSLKLYLERKYIINNKCNKDSSSKQNPMQLNGIIIEDNIHSGRFWTATTISKRWMKDLVNHVSELSGNQIISSSSCNILPIRTADKTHKYKESTNQNKNTNTVYNIGNGNQMNNWFIHESGAFLLGSLVLKENVCKYRNTASDVIASNQVSFSILNRINDRRILNYKEIQNKLKLLHNSFPSSSTISSSSISHTPQNSVVNITDTIDIDPIKTDNKSKAIPSSSSSSLLWNKQIKNITVHSFEGKSLFYQVQAMRSTDVLLTGHGAGNANIAWMKPCSIVIEVFPWAFYIPNYFGSLAKSAGLLYYSIQVCK